MLNEATFPNIGVLDMHADGGILKEFFCNFNLGTPLTYTCARVSELPPKFSNQKSDSSQVSGRLALKNEDLELAVTALGKAPNGSGWAKHKEDCRRVMSLASAWAEHKQGLNGQSQVVQELSPRRGLDIDVQRLLLQRASDLARSYAFIRRGEKALIEAKIDALSNSSLDVERVLDHPAWKLFFSNKAWKL